MMKIVTSKCMWKLGITKSNHEIWFHGIFPPQQLARTKKKSTSFQHSLLTPVLYKRKPADFFTFFCTHNPKKGKSKIVERFSLCDFYFLKTNFRVPDFITFSMCIYTCILVPRQQQQRQLLFHSISMPNAMNDDDDLMDSNEQRKQQKIAFSRRHAFKGRRLSQLPKELLLRKTVEGGMLLKKSHILW